LQDGLCPEQQFEALLGYVPVERFAGALTPLVSDNIQVCFAEGPTTRAFGHVIDAVTAPITSNRPTTHDYTTMRDATENVWVDKNLITANSAAGLDRARAILEYLDVYPVETINTWYQYYSTGNPEFFFKLMAN